MLNIHHPTPPWFRQTEWGGGKVEGREPGEAKTWAEKDGTKRQRRADEGRMREDSGGIYPTGILNFHSSSQTHKQVYKGEPERVKEKRWFTLAANCEWCQNDNHAWVPATMPKFIAISKFAAIGQNIKCIIEFQRFPHSAALTMPRGPQKWRLKFKTTTPLNAIIMKFLREKKQIVIKRFCSLDCLSKIYPQSSEASVWGWNAETEPPSW